MTGRAASHAVAFGVLGALTLAMFGDILFNSGDRVLSHPDVDLAQQFVGWRQFGFGELRHGNLALWNPHLYCGSPFFGGFQSALLYPLNVLFLLLPLASAINWSIALHVFLAGAFTYVWVARRGLHPWACLLSAIIFMFCGAHFAHIYAGHLPNLCTLVWAPLIFLAIDGLLEEPAFKWILLGMLTLAMQVLAGHPQYVFYTGVAAALYSVVCGLQAPNKARFLLGLMAMVAGGISLSAVQLFTGLAEARETLRSAGLSYARASVFSFAPENFVTLIAPYFFGGPPHPPYWGRFFWWETSGFISVTGLMLAVVGSIWGERPKRRWAIVMVLATLMLALGDFTPLFHVLYDWVPGFNRFRGSSKFIFIASLFLALLAGIGLDVLMRNRLLASDRQQPRRLPLQAFAIVVAALAVMVAAGGLWLQSSIATPDLGVWRKAMLAVRNAHQSDLSAATYEAPVFQVRTALHASNSLLLGAGTLAAVAGLLFLAGSGTSPPSPRSDVRANLCSPNRSNVIPRGAALLLLILAVAELFCFARASLASFPLRAAVDNHAKSVVAAHPGDYRILDISHPNMALTLGAYDIWGEDPSVLRRYAEVIAVTQDQAPDQAAQYIGFRHPHPLYDMLRLRFALVPEKGKITDEEFTNALPRLSLVSRFILLTNREEVLSVMTNTAFNPREVVLLESKPQPEPHASASPGKVGSLKTGTDFLTVEAEVESPSILLITDSYAKGWHASALPTSVQTKYQVMPANYCLRAIPLAAGHHHLRLEYRAPGFEIGKWVSLASLSALAGFLTLRFFSARRKLA